jgi:hypothetical protein
MNDILLVSIVCVATNLLSNPSQYAPLLVTRNNVYPTTYMDTANNSVKYIYHQTIANNLPRFNYSNVNHQPYQRR